MKSFSTKMPCGRGGRSSWYLPPITRKNSARTRLLADGGAESLDAARKDWWLGLRDGEQEHYRALGHNFELDEDVYRAAFTSVLRRECRGKSIDEVADCLKWWYPDVWDSEPFQRGYERGRKYWQQQAIGEALRAHAGSPAA